MNLIKALVEFAQALSKGTKFIVIGVVTLPFLTSFIEPSMNKLVLVFLIGIAIPLAGEAINKLDSIKNESTPEK